MASEEKKISPIKSLVENFSWSEQKLIINWQKQYKAVSERPRVELGRLLFPTLQPFAGGNGEMGRNYKGNMTKFASFLKSS